MEFNNRVWVALIGFVALLCGCGGSGGGGGSTPPPPAASPTFSGIAPATGYAGGGTSVTITGTNFRLGAAVTIGGSSALSVALVNSTTITALTPAHGMGSADVVITNSDSTSVTGPAAFAYAGNPAPTISSSFPDLITVGSTNTPVSITGMGYTEQSTVSVDGAQITSPFVSPTQLTATFPTAVLSAARLARLTIANPAPGGGSSDTGPAFTAGPTLPSPIYGETATVLQNGQVLVCGGANPNTGVATSNAELYNPATNQFTAVGAMTAPRFRHTATLLNSGRVLITGGLAVDSGFLQTYQSTEIFDPSTNTFTASGNMIAGRRSHTASLLISGKVLISGGTSNTGTATVTSELYDPATNAFSAGPQMVFDRSGHAAVSLTDGTVLILGGAANTISGGVASAGGLYLSAAELYNPATNGFVAVGSMQSARSLSAAVRLNDGRVLVSGGISNIGVVNQVEVYNPTTETFSITGATGWFGYAQNATLLADGKVLVTGGFGLTSYL